MRFRVVRRTKDVGVFTPIVGWVEATPLALEVEKQRNRVRGELIQYRYEDGEEVTQAYGTISSYYGYR